MNWTKFWLGMASYTAKKSKDPSTKVGAVIVDADNRIVSIGYNGAPSGVDDAWANENRDRKLLCTLHAESNAIDFAERSRLKGATIYVTHAPCSQCAGRIIQNKIKSVIYIDSKTSFDERWAASIGAARNMFVRANVELTPVKFDVSEVFVEHTYTELSPTQREHYEQQ